MDRIGSRYINHTHGEGGVIEVEPHHIFGGFLIVQDLGALHSIRLGRRLPRRRDLRRVEYLGLKAPVLEVSTRLTESDNHEGGIFCDVPTMKY